VPTGGAAASVSSGALTSAVTVTVPAGNFFHTAAGGISSWATTFQTQLNTNVLPFPDNAASLASAIGYGTWTTGAGWLMQEASGSLAASFGSPSLTAVSSPTYRNSGTTTGKYAVGFDSAADAFSGGDVFDATATDDLIVTWVGYNSSPPAASFDFIAKKGIGVPGFLIYENSGNSGFSFIVNDGVDAATVDLSTFIPGEWHVGMAVMERATNKMRMGLLSLSTSTTQVTAEASTTLIGSIANAVSLLVGNSGNTGNGPDSNTKIAALYVVAGSGVATGLSANLATALANFKSAVNSSFTVSLSTTTGLYTISNSFWTYGITWSDTNQRDLAGFTGNLSGATTNTATTHARGLWLTDCPLNLEGDPSQAPRVTDLRTTVSPTGGVLGLSGNSMYRHRGIVWSHVPKAQTWESAATYANGSFETFAKDAIYGLGHAWFTPASPLQIYWNDAGTQRALGYTFNSNAGVAGWSVLSLSSTEPKKSIDGWTGYFRIEFGDVVAVGG
jgi:hypothetical protein